MEHGTKLGKGLKALDKMEQTLGRGLVRKTRTPEILASCSLATTFHREWGAALGADHVPSPFLTLLPGRAQRSQDTAAATDEEKPQQRSQHGNTSSSPQQSRAAGGCSEPWMGAEVGGGGEEENPGLILFRVQVSTQMPRDLIPNK